MQVAKGDADMSVSAFMGAALRPTWRLPIAPGCGDCDTGHLVSGEGHATAHRAKPRWPVSSASTKKSRNCSPAMWRSSMPQGATPRAVCLLPMLPASGGVGNLLEYPEWKRPPAYRRDIALPPAVGSLWFREEGGHPDRLTPDITGAAGDLARSANGPCSFWKGCFGAAAASGR